VGNSTSTQQRPARSSCKAKRGGGTGAALTGAGAASASITGLLAARGVTDGLGTSIFGRSVGLLGAAAGLTEGLMISGTTGGSGSTSSSGREGAANGSSVRGTQLTTCMAVR